VTQYRRVRAIAIMSTLIIGFLATTSSIAYASPQESRIAASTPSCASRYICFWQNNNYGGAAASVYAPDWHSAWYSFSQAGVSFHPGSSVNGSNSAIYYWDAQNGTEWCVKGGGSDATMNNSFGYFYITYNAPDCGEITPPPGP
jgi:hypothetical protein